MRTAHIIMTCKNNALWFLLKQRHQPFRSPCLTGVKIHRRQFGLVFARGGICQLPLQRCPFLTQFGQDTPMKRAGQPNEVAPCFVFLACEDASYMTGQILHPNGGTVVNG